MMELDSLRESILFTVIDDIKFGVNYLKEKGLIKSDYILLVSSELYEVIKKYFENDFEEIDILHGYGVYGERFEFLQGETYEARFGEGKSIL